MTEPLSSGRLAWTGERCVPWSDEVQGIYEHLHRYHFAAGLVEGKTVLDLASGEGYGSAILASRARHVTGLEIDAASVMHSRRVHASRNLEFVEGSMLDLDACADGSFEAIVCFEALEHVAEHEQLVRGIARVVGDGLLILSTPDRDVYNASIHEANAFHVKELTRGELVDLLAGHFEHIALWGQSPIGGSRLELLSGATGTAESETLVSRHDGAWIVRHEAPSMYVVAVAATRPLPPGPRISYFVDPTSEALRERDRKVAARDARIRELKEENRRLYAENEQLHARSRLHLLRRASSAARRRVRSLRDAL